jgi:transposase InsO family protein
LLSNHREAIAAMDFFTVPVLGCGLLYCLFIIHHAKRRILQCNITRHPTTAWVSQQFLEAFPQDAAPRFLIFDREHTFVGEMKQTAVNLGIRPVQTPVRSAWQNGIAERWVGTCRRELLDHVIVLNRCHLKRLMTEYVRYYHDDRTHLGLGKDTPAGRKAAQSPTVNAEVVSIPRLGGLHHRYDLAA